MKKLTLIILSIFFSLLTTKAYAVIVPGKSPSVADSKSVKSGSYYDMDMTKIAQEIGLELKDEEEDMLNDLTFLWPYAVEHSETIKFAIYKLSDPQDKDKEKEKAKVKNLLKPIAAIAPVAALGSSSAMLGGSALIGGSFLQEVLQGSKTPLEKHIEKVTDTDLVLLAKSVEELQTKLVITYYDYITAKKVLFMTDEILKNRHKHYVQMQNSTDKNLVIADTFYRDAIQKQTKAREDFLIKRSSLEQIVGSEAIVLLEEQKQKQKEIQKNDKTKTEDKQKQENTPQKGADEKELKEQKQPKEDKNDKKDEKQDQPAENDAKSLKFQEKEFKKLKEKHKQSEEAKKQSQTKSQNKTTQKQQQQKK